MQSVNPSPSGFTTTLFTLAMIAAVGVSLWAQEAPAVHVGNTDIKGLPDDWTHHHVVYADPGTEEDAVKNGSHERWLKAVDDPRYVIQQLKQGLPVRGPAAQDVESRRRIAGQEGEMWKRWGGRGPRDPRGPWDPRDPKRPLPATATLDRDWSVGVGNGVASKTLTAVAPTAGNPASGSSTLALSAGGAATMTASAPTTQAGTITFGAAAPGGGTSFTSISGMRYNFVNATGFGTPGAGICTVYNGGGGGSRTTTETNLLGAMGAGVGSNTTWLCGSRAGQLFNVTGSVNGIGGHTIDVAANLAGATGFGVPNVGTSGFSYADSTMASDGASDGTHFTYWSGNAFDTPAQFATSLAASVNASADNGNVTATTSGASLTITADAAGTAGNLYTATSNFTHLTGSGTFTGGVDTSIQPNTFPAKYSFSTGTISASNCTSDYVVFPTGLAGSSSQATVVAYDNIYKTTCSTGSVPNTYWAYNTGGIAGLSPVLSGDGTQISYIQTSSGQASLVMLKWGTTGGTVGAPAAITLAANAGAYHSCSTLCYYAIPLNGTPNDTNSSPYYDYANDIMYVGDNSGKLHKFTGVFAGSPAEAGAPWPITVTTTAGKLTLTSPVYDSGSGNVFVADSGGYLYSYKASTAALVMKTSQLAISTVGIVDGPVIDSTLQSVYVFVGNDGNTSGGLGCDVTTGCVGTYQFATTTAGTGNGVCTATSATAWGATVCGVEAVSGTATAATPAYYDGAFDNIYIASANGTGHLWGCAPHVGSTPRLEATAINANAIVPSGDVYSAGNVTNGPVLSSATSACTPVTEVYGSNGTTDDYLFMSVPTAGQLTGCTGACVYNFVVATGGTYAMPANATDGLQESGGTSAIIIDNLSATAAGGSEVYFMTLGSQTCTTSASIGWCATQATQPALQ